MTTQPPSILQLDSRAIKVLAHPLRSRLLSALRIGGPATATVLAHDLGTNTGATSYHLRKLASVGLVEETADGRGRERPWRAATEMHGWTERAVADDPDARAAADWLRRHYLHGFVERYEAWLEALGRWSLDWQDAASASDFALRLTPDRLVAFNRDIEAVYERYRALPPAEDAADHPADEETIQVFVHAFPIEPSRR